MVLLFTLIVFPDPVDPADNSIAETCEVVTAVFNVIVLSVSYTHLRAHETN
jgi:hypothetical protein